MKFNSEELIKTSYGDPAIEGRLQYKKIGSGRSQNGFKERWFKLRLNFLFYFSLSETGTVVDEKPSGAFVLEHCQANYEETLDVPFAFSLKFNSESDKIIFSGRSEEHVKKWVLAINTASYQYLRHRLIQLKTQLGLLKQGLNCEQSLIATTENPKQVVPSKINLMKQESFRSYLPPEGNLQLFFNENHFRDFSLENRAQNALEAIGFSQTSSKVKLYSSPANQNETPAGDSNSSQTWNNAGSVIPRPRPLRKAPDPPLRPPRGQKPNNGVSSRSNENLIDF